jgi:uncharacterized protein (DUF305 family)
MRVMREARVRQSLAVALVVVATACGSAGAGSPEAIAPPEAPSDRGELTAAEMEAIYRERVAAERTRFTEADVRFMTGMIHHHAQAIEISLLAPTRAESTSIRTLAARIINAQQDEIALMQRWLQDRDRPAPELHVMDGRVMVHGTGHDHMEGMPGMLSPEQITRLAAASGPEFDRLFLTFMIEHHEGAVFMVRELFATDGAGQDEDVFRFASDVQVDQATEVARMQRMLDAMPPEDGRR